MLKTQFKFIFLFVLITLTSCVSKKKILYFQDSNEVIKDIQNFALKFKKDDLLVINVTAPNPETVKDYNLPTVAYSTQAGSVNGVPKQQTYLIDTEGYIKFPVLGKIKLEGLTRVEAIKLIEDKIKSSVKKVMVNIQILNFKINVLGDVKNPGTFPITNERITILDALALAGDTNISAVRIVEVKRETSKGLETGFVDLKSNRMFSSPYFYLQQNDVVYVNPNNAKIQSATYNQNTGLFISIASVLISLISILTR